MEGDSVNRSKILKDIATTTKKKPPLSHKSRGLKVKQKGEQSVKPALRKPRPPVSASSGDGTTRNSSASSKTRPPSNRQKESDSVLNELNLNNIGSSDPSSHNKQASPGGKGQSKVKFVSPRQVLQPVNDSSYHITDSGVEEELSSAFLTDFPEYSVTDSNSFCTADFFDRFEYLNTYLSELQDDCKTEPPKSILKPERPLSADAAEKDPVDKGRSKGRPHSAVLEREVVRKQDTSSEPLGNYRPHSTSVTESRYNDKDSRYLLINQGTTYELDLGRCTCGLHGYHHKGGRTSSSSQKDTDIRLEPYVYGYQSGKQICAFEEPGEGSLDLDQYMDLILRVPTAEDGESLVDDKEEEEDPFGIPSTLKAFVPWITTDVPESVIGVDPMECLVFLPGLKLTEELPMVPPPQMPHEELNFKYQIKPSKIRVKKYDHPWTKKPVEEWKCSHDSQVVGTPRIKVIANSGRVMHETYDGERTPQILRKEIQELEDLMKGIGSFDGCVVVQMQAQINQIKDTLEEMMPRIQEIQERERLKKEGEEPTDYLGMKSFYRHHDETLTQIRHQHRLCVLELIHLENTGDLDSGRKMFTRSRSEAVE